jgi:hypothetical protein
MSKKKPRPRNHGKTPDQLAPYDFVQHCAKLLKARVAAGVYRDKPGLEAAITEFDPALALIEIAADPANTPDMRAAVSAKLMPYWHKEQSLLVKEAGSGNMPVTISISVAPWAQGPGRALPPPQGDNGKKRRCLRPLTSEYARSCKSFSSSASACGSMSSALT